MPLSVQAHFGLNNGPGTAFALRLNHHNYHGVDFKQLAMNIEEYAKLREKKDTNRKAASQIR